MKSSLLAVLLSNILIYTLAKLTLKRRNKTACPIEKTLRCSVSHLDNVPITQEKCGTSYCITSGQECEWNLTAGKCGPKETICNVSCMVESMTVKYCTFLKHDECLKSHIEKKTENSQIIKYNCVFYQISGTPICQAARLPCSTNETQV
jgi:hypothetical protein